MEARIEVECGFCGGRDGAHFPECDPNALAELEAEPEAQPESFSERVRAGMAVEEAHKRRVREAGPARSAANRAGVVHYEKLGQSRDAGAARAGLNVSAYERAKRIVARADADPSRFGDLPDMAATRGIWRAATEMERRLGSAAVRSVVHSHARLASAKTEARNLLRALDGIVSACGAVSVESLIEDADRKDLAAGIGRAVRKLNDLRRALA